MFATAIVCTVCPHCAMLIHFAYHSVLLVASSSSKSKKYFSFCDAKKTGVVIIRLHHYLLFIISVSGLFIT